MKEVYVIMAVDSGEDEDATMELYAVADSEETAQAIIDRDVDDGQILDNAYFERMKLNTMQDV